MVNTREIIVRRFKRGNNGFDKIQIALDKNLLAGGYDRKNIPQVTFFTWVEEDVCFYKILLPEEFEVLPGDWRSFAYDHQKISDILFNCAKDNTSESLFELLSDEDLKLLETRLKIALHDLILIFETSNVTCERNDIFDGINVVVEGEHKMGIA